MHLHSLLREILRAAELSPSSSVCVARQTDQIQSHFEVLSHYGKKVGVIVIIMFFMLSSRNGIKP